MGSYSAVEIVTHRKLVPLVLAVFDGYRVTLPDPPDKHSLFAAALSVGIEELEGNHHADVVYGSPHPESARITFYEQSQGGYEEVESLVSLGIPHIAYTSPCHGEWGCSVSVFGVGIHRESTTDTDWNPTVEMENGVICKDSMLMAQMFAKSFRVVAEYCSRELPTVGLDSLAYAYLVHAGVIRKSEVLSVENDDEVLLPIDIP